jgi:hypothetical protein
LTLGSGTARRLESKLPDANEPGGIEQVKPGRRTATMNFQDQRRSVFL